MRYCLACDLKDDPELIAQYKAYHEEVWPEILESIREGGIKDMEIFLTGNRLFMIMEVDKGFDFEHKARLDAENPRVQEWERLMDRFQQYLPWGKGAKWVLMDKIFSL